MANRIVAVYEGDAATHTITFTPPTPGARLILVATTWFDVDSVEDDDGPWPQDEAQFGFNGGAIHSKIAVGDETSVTFTTQDAPTQAVLYERDDCGQRVFSRAVQSSQTALQTSSVNVPALAFGRVFAVVATGGGSVAGATWTQGLVQHHAPTALDLNSGFAHGPMPSPGSRTFRVSGVPVGPDDSILVVVGYGTVDATPPSVPGSLRATNIEDDSITMEWDASTDDFGVSGYGIYKNGVKQGGDQTALTYTFGSLTMGQTYTLGVDSVDLAGNRSAKAEIVVMAVLDVDPPTTPGDLRVVEVTHNSIAVAWDASTDNVGVAGYGVWLGGVKQGQDLAGLEHVVTRLARDTSYTIEVDAVDARGNRSARASVEAETLAGADPGEPPGVTAAPGREQITLAWGAAEPGASPIARYEILLDGVVVAATEALSFVLEELEAGGSYEVGVRAVDEESVHGPVVSVVVEVPAADWLPVATPVYRLGGWVANAVDAHGVTWVVEDEDGWSSSALPETLSADLDAGDGGFSGPGKYGARIITLSGTAIAPGRTQMLAAQERLTGVLSAAGVGVLQVAEAHLTRQAQVRLEDQVEVTDRGAYAFEWVLTLRAADPRRYRRRGVYAEAVFEPGQTFGHTTVVMDGDYPAIPARLRLVGPIKNPVIGIDELGLEIRSLPDTVLPDSRYELTFDLGTRTVWAIVPPEVWPEPRPGRRALATFPARFALGPGPNTIRLSGELVEGQELSPRLVVEARDAWI